MRAVHTRTGEVGEFLGWCKGAFGRRCAKMKFGMNQHSRIERIYHRYVVMEGEVGFCMSMGMHRITTRISKLLEKPSPWIEVVK